MTSPVQEKTQVKEEDVVPSVAVYINNGGLRIGAGLYEVNIRLFSKGVVRLCVVDPCMRLDVQAAFGLGHNEVGPPVVVQIMQFGMGLRLRRLGKRVGVASRVCLSILRGRAMERYRDRDQIIPIRTVCKLDGTALMNASA